MKINSNKIQLRRSKRRTIGLEVTRFGEIIVRAPQDVPMKRIDTFLNNKSDWLNKHLKTAKIHKELYPEITYADGNLLWFKGNKYTLRLVNNSRTKILLNDFDGIIYCMESDAKTEILEWYNKQASLCINARVKDFAALHDFQYKSVRITNAKTRWGSCGVKNTLNFSWRLIKAPTPVIDYVILHELVHTEIKNHGKEFWRRMKVADKDYKEHRAWLKEHALMLLRD